MNNYWIITLKGGGRVMANNEEFNKISPEIYLSAMRLDSLDEAVIMLHKLYHDGYKNTEDAKIIPVKDVNKNLQM